MPPNAATNKILGKIAFTTTLSDADVRNLIKKLSDREREKRELRKKQQTERSDGVERDW